MSPRSPLTRGPVTDRRGGQPRPGTRLLAISAGFAGLLAILGLAFAAAAGAATGDVGVRDFSFGAQVGDPTANKPQSKLWFDSSGRWYGGFFVPGGTKDRFYIHELVGATWQDSGVRVDNRNQSHADYLFDESAGKLYVASSHPGCLGAAGCSDDIRIYRFSYNGGAALAGRFTSDSAVAGDPFASIAAVGASTVTIAKASDGLWIAYPKAGSVMVSRSTDGGASWSTPFALPVQGDAPLYETDKDIAAIVAFGSPTVDKVGVMWSSHKPGFTTGLYFAVHNGADLEGTWQARETVVSGPEMADNHVNLKADSAGNVYAVTKTGKDGGPATGDLILLHDRSSGGTWSSNRVSIVGDLNTRPQLLIDEQLGVAYVFMTAPNGGGTTYYKSAPLDALNSFPVGTSTVSMPGTPFIRSSLDPKIDDPTTTKQVVNATSDIVVEASDITTDTYLHATLALEAADATGPIGTVTINGGAPFTSAALVSVGVSAADAGSGVSLVRLKNVTAGSPCGSLDTGATTFAYATPIAWTLAAGPDGDRLVCAQWRDGAGNWSSVASDTIALDTTTPSGTVSINSGATATKTTSVTLDLSATDGAGSGVSQAIISNSSDMSGASTVAYAASVPWTLAGGADGSRTVYVKFVDALGNTAPSAVNDSINLDTTPPTQGTATVDGGASFTPDLNVTLALAGAGGDATQARASNSPDMSGAAAIGLSGGSWTLAAGPDGPRTVYVQWADALGNWSSPVASNSIILDTGAPSGSVSINGGASATNSLAVTLALPATDGDVDAVLVSNNSDMSGATTFPYPPTIESWTLPDPAGLDGPRTVYVRWQDLADNLSAVASASIVLDRVAPTAGSAPRQRLGTGTVSGIPVLATWRSGGDSLSGVASFVLQVRRDTGAYQTVATPTSTSTTVYLASGHTYRFRVATVDRAGNVGPFTVGSAFRLRAFQERSTAIRYRGTWRYGTSTAFYGRGAKWATRRLASATFTFTGRSVAWVAPRNLAGGSARVYVDGRYVKTVSLYSTSSLARQVVFTRTWTTSRTHAVRILVLGTLRHPRVTVDAFLVMR